MRQTVTCLRAEGDVEFKYRAFPSRKLCSHGDLVVLGSSTRLTAKSSEQPEVTTYKSNFSSFFCKAITRLEVNTFARLEVTTVACLVSPKFLNKAFFS